MSDDIRQCCRCLKYSDRASIVREWTRTSDGLVCAVCQAKHEQAERHRRQVREQWERHMAKLRGEA